MMPLAQDQFRQKIHKGHETQLHLKQDASKQLFADPKEIWKIKSVCEDKSVSGNESEADAEENVACKKSHFKFAEERHFGEDKLGGLYNRKGCASQKNVRFEAEEYSSVDEASAENDYSDPECGDKGSCLQHDREACRFCAGNDRDGSGEVKRSCVMDQGEGRGEKMPEEHYFRGHEGGECRDFCGKYKAKARQAWDYACEVRGGKAAGAPAESRRMPREEFEPVLHRVRRPSPKSKFGHGKPYCEALGPHDQRCGKQHDFPRSRSYAGDCEEKMHRCGDWCERYASEEPRGPCEPRRSQKSVTSIHVARHPKQHKHKRKEKPGEAEWKKGSEKEDAKARSNHSGSMHAPPKLEQDCYYHPKEFCEHAFSTTTTTTSMTKQQKKKILDSYEELPVVNESQEHLSDATYNVSFSKCSNLNAKDSATNFTHEKVCGDNVKDMLDKSPSWFYYNDKMTGGGALSENLRDEIHPERTVKMRSRWTKMNRSRKNRWMKAFIHDVMERSRNEIIGLMVLGPRGPELYSRMSSKKASNMPFRKSRSFPEGPTKSYEMSTNLEPKDVFITASDPGRKEGFSANDLICPEEDTKVEEKIATFDKNVNEIVKSTEEKFLQALTKEQFPEDDGKASHDGTGKGGQESEHNEGKVVESGKSEMSKKFSSFNLMPVELLSARKPKPLRTKTDKPGRDVFAFNVESKILADSLNEQAKQFRMSQLNQKEDISTKLTEMEQKFPTRPRDKEAIEANLTLWGMKLNDPDAKEIQSTGGEGDGMDSHREFARPTAPKRSTDSGDHDRTQSKEKNAANEKIKVEGGGQQGSGRSKEEKTPSAQARRYYEASANIAKNIEKFYTDAEGRKKKGGDDKPTEMESDKLNEILSKSSKWTDSPRKRDDEAFDEEQTTTVSEKKSRENDDEDQMLRDIFKDLIKNGCAISENESENLQKIFKDIRYEAEFLGADASCSMSSVEQGKAPEIKEDASARYSKTRSPRADDESSKKSRAKDADASSRRNDDDDDSQRKYSRYSRDGSQGSRWMQEEKKKESKKASEDVRDGYLSDTMSKRCSKMKARKEELSEAKACKKLQAKQREVKSKKRQLTLEKMKLLRDALPSMAAENEAAHLKQLKKYIHRFIDRVEHKTSSSSEARARRQAKMKSRDSTSSDSSEVRVDAQKIIDLMSNPFKRITSDMTINMAKRLTDALVQENSPKSQKTHKNSEDGTAEEDASLPCATTSGSDRGDEVEPTYLKQLKKMRNDHLSNIIMEVRRLHELLRFLDRCNRLKL